MYSRWRCGCRRLAVRLLWLICCTACASSLFVVFMSVQYLEDHREGSTRNTENTGSSLSFLEQNARRGLEDILKENQDLKQTVKRLAQFSHTGRAGGGVPGGLHAPQDRISSWQERSLKYIASEVQWPRSDVVSSIPDDPILNCRDVARIHIVKEMGRGYTKITQLGVYEGLEVAVKSAGLDSNDVRRCVKEKRSKLPKDCLMFSRYKIMKELLLYQQLRHPNVAKLLGYCLQNDQDTADIRSRGLTVVTELGSPIDVMAVLQMPWHQRFRIAVGLARLMYFFSQSPLGSLVIRDFQLTQFVLVDGEIKMSDLDDVGNEPYVCRARNDCLIGNEAHNITLECLWNKCRGYNEKLNIYNLHRFYLKMFLLPGALEHVRLDLKKLENQVSLMKCDSKCLVQGLERVLTKLRTGRGLSTVSKSATQYKAIPCADFPGHHDYECSESMAMTNCQFLVFNEDEAKTRCNENRQCKAFVMSYKKIWTGYRSVYLKNDTTNLAFSAQNIVYIKVT